ncbi:hypothetical protein [Pararhodobacter aggregans]|uniref:hypothetical protein n=1 Tax=Pararhodobacter aggregans TaxID=404875 RepID=UPI003A950A23
MRLQLQGVVNTGVALLDSGITDLEIGVVNGVVHLYASTGRNGGIAEYVVGAEGQVSLHTTVIFPASITGGVSDRLVIAETGSGGMLMIGERASGLVAYALRADGGIGGQATIDWQAVDTAIGQGSDAHLSARVTLSDGTLALFPAGTDTSQVIELRCATVNGRDFVLTADQTGNSVTAYRVDGTGALSAAGTMGAAQGLGIDAPTAMEVVTIGDRTYVVLAAANTSSLSVMELTADGQLVPTDHLVDTGNTRFEGVQAMDMIQAGGHTFVVAGGADNGITVFELLPDGTMVAIATLADDNTTSMHRVTAITLAVEGDTMHVFVGSQNDSGITEYRVSLSSLGETVQGSAAAERLAGTGRDDVLLASGTNDTLVGGGGDDILVTGGTGTVMSGGIGADVFVVRAGSGGAVITDFDRGLDRLDLSDLPMLRDVSQLNFTATSTGCVIEYRGHTLVITSSNGQPLRQADVFPNGFDWADRYAFIPPEPETPASTGVAREGSAVGDLMNGTARDDTLSGGFGKDTLNGGDGNDLLDGGDGRDLIGATSGNNTLLGGYGQDTINGGTGDDWIEGGGGKDILYGDAGSDTIHGGDGRDIIRSGGGNDLVYAGSGGGGIFLASGDDTAYGGDGRDVIQGQAGSDLIYGGEGNDNIRGGGENDTLHGEGGNDMLDGGGGEDLLNGGWGNDTLRGAAGNDTLLGDNGNDLLEGGSGNDVLDGGADDDRLYGGEGHDSLIGGSGNDSLYGEDGNDTLIGAWGDDWLNGGAGNDALAGGGGNDTLRGGPGYDTLWGGSGADVFEFFRDHDTGQVMDFNPDDGDLIRLDDWIWFSLGDLTAEEVVDRFGSLDEAGNVVLDFSDVGGNVVVLNGFNDLDALPAHIEIM